MRYLRALLLAGMLLIIMSSVYAQLADTDQRFSRGKKLIEANCGDCTGATRKGLEEGIQEVQKAIADGFSDPIRAYKLLSDAYNTLAFVYAAPDSKDQQRLFLLKQQTLEKLLELDPKDARIRYEYAKATKDTVKQIAALRELIASDPQDADARFSLGMLLVSSGQLDGGIKELKEAVDRADLDRAETYAKKLHHVLIRHGRIAEAAEVSKQLELRKRKQNKP